MEATKNIFCAKAEGAVDHNTVIRWHIYLCLPPDRICTQGLFYNVSFREWRGQVQILARVLLDLCWL